MILENNNNKECPVVAFHGAKRQCPFAADDEIDMEKKKKSSSGTSAPCIMPPTPPGWRSYWIVGHAPMLKRYFEEGGEAAPAMIKAFNMCDGDMSSLDIPGMSEGGMYFTSNADYAGIVSTDLEHWGKITHTDTRGPFYMARQVIGKWYIRIHC